MLLRSGVLGTLRSLMNCQALLVRCVCNMASNRVESQSRWWSGGEVGGILTCISECTNIACSWTVESYVCAKPDAAYHSVVCCDHHSLASLFVTQRLSKQLFALNVLWSILAKRYDYYNKALWAFESETRCFSVCLCVWAVKYWEDRARLNSRQSEQMWEGRQRHRGEHRTSKSGSNQRREIYQKIGK